MNPKVFGILKLLLALAIPAILIGGFIYSQKQADIALEEHNQYIKEHPSIQKMTVDNYQLKEIDGTLGPKWQLQAKQGTVEPTTKDVDLVDVKMKCFDGAKVKMSLSAPNGVANENTHLVKLSSDTKTPVLCEGDGGALMQAPKVELTKKNQFIASGGVTIVYPGVAKVTGSTVTGSLKNADLKNFKIVGRTHALIGHM